MSAETPFNQFLERSNFTPEAQTVLRTALQRSQELGHPLGTDDLAFALVDDPVCKFAVEEFGSVADIQAKLNLSKRSKDTERRWRKNGDDIEQEAIKEILVRATVISIPIDHTVTSAGMLAALLVQGEGVGYYVLTDFLDDAKADGDTTEFPSIRLFDKLVNLGRSSLSSV